MSSYMIYFMLQMIIGIIAICFGIKTFNQRLYKSSKSVRKVRKIVKHCK